MACQRGVGNGCLYLRVPGIGHCGPSGASVFHGEPPEAGRSVRDGCRRQGMTCQGVLTHQFRSGARWDADSPTTGSLRRLVANTKRVDPHPRWQGPDIQIPPYHLLRPGAQIRLRAGRIQRHTTVWEPARRRIRKGGLALSLWPGKTDAHQPNACLSSETAAGHIRPRRLACSKN